MSEIIAELSKPVWWFSVVIAGILINLISTYIRSLLDQSINQTAHWWRTHSNKRRDAWNTRVCRIAADPQYKRAQEVEEVRWRLQSIHLILIAMFFWMFYLYAADIGLPPLFRAIILAGTAVVVFSAHVAVSHAGTTARALETAQNQIEGKESD